MFSLMKSNEIWTLSYKASLLWRIVAIIAGFAFLPMTISTLHESWSDVSPLLLAPFALGILGWVGGAIYIDPHTTTVFDLGQRRVTVHCQRPWFGPPRSFAFAEITALQTLNVSNSDDPEPRWEQVEMEFRDGTRITLGREPIWCNERIRDYLDDIRRATGIALKIELGHR
jgi:hypothetical protein